MSSTTALDAALAGALDAEVHRLGLAEAEPPPVPEPIAVRRRRRGAAPGGVCATISLVRIDGVLRWTYQRPPRGLGPRRAARAGTLVGAEPIYSYTFREVGPNRVIEKLEELDARLTPARGLSVLTGGALRSIERPAQTRRALLLIHGTFSKADPMVAELAASPDGARFLARAAAEYEQILAFNHPTLSVSPLLNALDLERCLAGYDGTVDIVCHSRGGLVAAWWLRMAPRKVGRVVFVGSPLAGTSLASPERLKKSLDLLANIACAVEQMGRAAGAFVPPAAPLLGVAAGLLQVLGGVLALGARSPLLDTGVAVVAGLAAQSLVSNNQELIRLHETTWPSRPTCYAVRSDFEPVDPETPAWQFWKRLRTPLLSAADVGADALFDGPNDLVVDVPSMTRLFGKTLPDANVCDFRPRDTVHHCNYFAQPKTAAFLAKTLLEAKRA